MLIDSTLREGAQAYGVYFTPGARRRMAMILAAACVDEIECGWLGQDGLAEFLGWARATLPRPEQGGPALSLWCPCREADVREAASLDVDRLSIGAPSSAAHRQKRLGLTLDEMCARVRTVVATARAGKIPYISVGLEDASRAALPEALAVARAALGAGAARIRVSDTVGVLTPLSTARLVEVFVRELDVPVAFHGHNDLGMATANAVTALESGASFVDVSALGLGERAGIAALEEVAAWLALRTCASPGPVPAPVSAYDVPALRELCRVAAQAARVPLARNKAVAGEDVFAAESGLHVHGLLRDPALFEPFAPEAVGATRRMAVGAKSGGAAVEAAIGSALVRLRRLPGEDCRCDSGLMERVRGLAGRLGRPLTDSELLGVL
ncbi:MAG: pyruvate carboxyltransferase [Deltaproteobacteria bacterium HGW-Deltaproteobacteria-8]|jgi:homocitrate synthase NifV|nr:MAG: pyruvate carboxyltransferase [Deltaproteobacteria bacterium HGW-Deltaproteobacteria-8]